MNDRFGFIRDTQDIELDFPDLPFTVTEFYSLLGFPDYLASLASIERVSDNLREEVEQFEEREDALRERFQEAMG